LSDIEQVFVNGHSDRRVPHNLNMSFNFVEGESLIMGCKGIAVSSGSACTSASLEPSYVLRALGRSDELAHSSLRMTIGRFTTADEIDTAVSHLRYLVQHNGGVFMAPWAKTESWTLSTMHTGADADRFVANMRRTAELVASITDRHSELFAVGSVT